MSHHSHPQADGVHAEYACPNIDLLGAQKAAKTWRVSLGFSTYCNPLVYARTLLGGGHLKQVGGHC